MAEKHEQNVWLQTQRGYSRFGLQAGDCLRLGNQEPGGHSRVAIGSREHFLLGECYLESGQLWVRIEGESGPTGETIELAKVPVLGVATGFARDLTKRPPRGWVSGSVPPSAGGATTD